MLHNSAKTSWRQGISRIGLVIVLGVSTLLVAFILQGVDQFRDAAARTQCVNNLKQILLGIHNFEGTFKRLPPLYGGSVTGGPYQASGRFPRIWGSTHVFILPYV